MTKFSKHLILFISVTFAQHAFAANSTVCTVPADADILGLGVRLGIYFQLSSIIYIGIIRPGEAAESIPVTNIFMSGVFVSFIYSTVVDGYPSGAMICALSLLIIDLPLILPISLTVAATGKLGNSVSFESVSVCVFRWIAFNSFSVWFWYHGLDEYNVSPCQEPRVFFFANVSATGHIRTLYKYLTTSAAVLSFFIVFIWVILLVTRMFHKDGLKGIQEKIGKGYDQWVQSQGETGDNDFDVTYARVFPVVFGNGLVSGFCLGVYGALVGSITMMPLLLQALGLPVFKTSRYQRVGKVLFATLGGGLVLVLCILPVELQIKWNKLAGVGGISSTGQLMALTIGSFSLLRAIWLVLTKPEEKEEGGGETPNPAVEVSPSSTHV